MTLEFLAGIVVGAVTFVPLALLYLVRPVDGEEEVDVEPAVVRAAHGMWKHQSKAFGLPDWNNIQEPQRTAVVDSTRIAIEEFAKS